MSDLSPQECEAMEAARKKAAQRAYAGEPRVGSVFHEGWLAHRDYIEPREEELEKAHKERFGQLMQVAEREKKLREALKATVLAVPDWGFPYSTSDGSDDPARCSAEALVDALAENGDTDGA